MTDLLADSECDRAPRCVLHVPHSSTAVPPEAAAAMTLGEGALAAELALMTDHDTDELMAAPGPDFVQVRFPVSRIVVDPERFVDDEAEPMAARGMGVIYERTADGRVLREPPTPGQREELLATWYRPHHARLEDLTRQALAAHGRALIVDCHSFPDTPIPCDLDPMVDRPDVCIGTHPVHTPPPVLEALLRECRDIGWSVAVNRPYAGTIVPLAFFGRDPRVASVMIELNRRLYLESGCEGARRSDGFEATRLGTQRLLKTALAASVLLPG